MACLGHGFHVQWLSQCIERGMVLDVYTREALVGWVDGEIFELSSLRSGCVHGYVDFIGFS